MITTIKGKKGLIIGIANSHSIAFGCAKSLRELGCDQIIATYLNPSAHPFVAEACADIGITNLVEFNFVDETSVETLFDYVKQQFGSIDFVIHAMAFADRESLQGRVIDCKWDGFASSLHTSCFSLINICNHAEKIMHEGGAIITMSYIGADRALANYGIMGPIKACLESTVRYLASELAEKNIRIFAVSPGPMQTRAASGIANFQSMVHNAIELSPMHRTVTLDEVGNLSAFLISSMASGMTGQTIYVDGGFSIAG